MSRNDASGASQPVRRIRSVPAIAAVELRRFLRDRSNIFFVFILPLALIFVLGSQFGGDGPSGRVAISGAEGSLRAAVVDRLEADDVQLAYAEPDAVRDLVARGRTDVGLQITPADETAYTEGRDVELETLTSSQLSGQATVQQLTAAVQAATERDQQVAALARAGAEEPAIRRALKTAERQVEPPALQVEDVDEVSREFEGIGRYDQGAAGQLILFVFLISLAGSTTLILARRQGVIARTLASPVSSLQALSGQALGRWAIAVFQGGYIMLTTAVLYGVDWGSAMLSVLVLVVFGSVAAGAAMLLGAMIDNESAASGVGVGLGLVLAALGGCMTPLELFPDTLRTIAHVTPHAWAYEAFAEIQRHGGSLVDILPQLGVLIGMATVLLLLGAWALRRSLARAM